MPCRPAFERDFPKNILSFPANKITFDYPILWEALEISSLVCLQYYTVKDQDLK